jgi:hypothetical protein
MPERVSTRIGAIAMGGRAKTAMFTPRNSLSATGESAKMTPAAMATRFPMTKPAPDAASVAQIWRG